MKKSSAIGAIILLGAIAAPASFHFVTARSHQASVSSNHQGKPDVPVQLWTCGMHPQVVQDHPGDCPICHMKLTPMHLHAADGKMIRNGPPVVVIDPAVVQNMGVQTAAVTRGPLTKSVRTVGTLEAPEPGLHDITLKVGGWIEKLYANQEGMHVHQGDPLLDLYSPDLLVVGEELVGAVKARDGLAVDADPSLKKSSGEFVASTRHKLVLLDVPEADIDRIIKSQVVPRLFTFRSPASGAVVDKAVVEGSAVQIGTRLMRIEDHGTLWLDLQVYEDQLSLVSVGQTVEATVPAWPGRTFHGTVTFVHPHVDHMSRTVIARAILENADLVLLPGMYAAAEILTRPVNDAIQIPREAVIDTGTRQIVFVARSNGHFEARPVRIGIAGDDGHVQILEGLSPGETVVTSGQFLLDVESRTTEAIEKLREASNPAIGGRP